MTIALLVIQGVIVIMSTKVVGRLNSLAVGVELAIVVVLVVALTVSITDMHTPCPQARESTYEHADSGHRSPARAGHRDDHDAARLLTGVVYLANMLNFKWDVLDHEPGQARASSGGRELALATTTASLSP